MTPWLRLLRPAHWIKNLVCLAGVLFYQQYQHMWTAIGVAVAFTGVSAAVYILNDIMDVARDRIHPKKRNRSLASGQISMQSAWMVGLVLAITAVTMAFLINLQAGCCCVGYLTINIAYSIKLKHLPIADAFCIALGFVLRLLAGIYVLNVLPIGWLMLFTFFLSLFLGFAKRRAELVAMEDQIDATERRPVLDHYSLSFLDGALDTSAALAIVCYALFLLLPSSLHQNPTLVVTVPFIVFMVLHYRRRLTHPKYRIEPNRIVYHDRVMQICALIWLLVYVFVQRSGALWFE